MKDFIVKAKSFTVYFDNYKRNICEAFGFLFRKRTSYYLKKHKEYYIFKILKEINKRKHYNWIYVKINEVYP